MKPSLIDEDVRQPIMLPVDSGVYQIGTSSDDIKYLQLKQSEWAYEWTDNELFDNERPLSKVKVDSFEIAQFPVTNTEYYQFILSSGYRLPRLWNGFTFPIDMGEHPIVSVSKVDAENYIQWLNRKTDSTYRLPTEAEWETAARGKDARIYPWGNTFDPWRCNTSESAKRGTTPVGAYSPSGDSPFGIADMVGNVWEWTSSIFEPYPYNPENELAAQTPAANYVIRGGAWYYTRKLARCAVREGTQGNSLSSLIGFRLARDGQDRD